MGLSRTEDFEAVMKGEGGVDVILDMVGAPYFDKNLTVLKDLGRLCYIAFLHGSKVEGDLTRLMLKRLTVTGSTLRIRTDAYKAKLAEGRRRPCLADDQPGPVQAPHRPGLYLGGSRRRPRPDGGRRACRKNNYAGRRLNP